MIYGVINKGAIFFWFRHSAPRPN